MTKMPRIISHFVLITFLLCISSTISTFAQFDKKYLLKTKFDINGVFYKFNSNANFADPDPRPSLILILLRENCNYSIRFKRKIRELINNLENVSLSSKFELKIYTCPLDDTCAKIFNSKAYPEVRFYSVKESPRKYFIRYKSKGPIMITPLLKWMNRLKEVSDGKNDMLRLDWESIQKSKNKLDDGVNKGVKVMGDVKNKENNRMIKKLEKRMRKIGYYYGMLNDFSDLNQWKKLYKRVVSNKRELIIFCRDLLSQKEYFIYRKIVSLYPNVKTLELRKCKQFRESENNEMSKNILKMISDVFTTKTRTWTPKSGKFMLKTFKKIFNNIISGKKQNLYFINFEHYYFNKFTKKNLENLKRFRKVFKAKSRPLLLNLTSSVMKKIMHNSYQALFLFLSGKESDKERKSMIRSFKEVSKTVRYDKNMYFIVVGGKI